MDNIFDFIEDKNKEIRTIRKEMDEQTAKLIENADKSTQCFICGELRNEITKVILRNIEPSKRTKLRIDTSNLWNLKRDLETAARYIQLLESIDRQGFKSAMVDTRNALAVIELFR